MSTAARAAKAYLGIGEVLSMLRQDFPDVTISKIRFLESEGLVEPERTSAGYRKFSRGDVNRLRYILAAQRDQYLPLRVIKDNLDAADRGLAPDGVAGAPKAPLAAVPDSGLPTAGDFAPPVSELRMSREELVAASGLTDPQLTELESYNLLGPVQGSDFYDGDALAVARAAGGMAGFGLEPRHLRTLRMAADREIALVRQVVTPLEAQRSPEAKARAEEICRELGALSVSLHTSLVRAGLAAARGR